MHFLCLVAVLLISSVCARYVSSGDDGLKVASHFRGAHTHSAAVVGDSSPTVFENPEGVSQTVELLHFVTPYHTGFESLVDLTPYSPLIRAIREPQRSSSFAEVAENVTRSGVGFYAFVDTWVGDHHNKKDTKVAKNSTGKCRLHQERQRDTSGNGWGISADLVFWSSKPHQADTRPKHSVTLASGYFGGTYPIGKVDILQGTATKDGSSVLLDKPADFSNTVEAPCFACEEGERTLTMAKRLGAVDYKLQNGEADVEQMADEEFHNHVQSNLEDLGTTKVDAQQQTVDANFDSSKAEVQVGTPVFFKPGDVPGGQTGQVGKVISVGEHGAVRVQMDDSSCLPMGFDDQKANGAASMLETSVEYRPRLVVPRNSKVLATAQAIADGLKQRAAGGGTPRESDRSLDSYGRTNRGPTERAAVLLEQKVLEQKDDASVLQHLDQATRFLEPFISSRGRKGLGKLVPLKFLGDADLPNADRAPRKVPSLLEMHSLHRAQDGDKVCVLKQDRTGRVLERTFDLPPMAKGDAALLQLAVTGHGWEKTQLGCGEYCHAVYKVSFNGGKAQDITQWRDDCGQNPTGSQDGTYDESRNGWCPGSVQSGTFLDVTEHLKTHSWKPQKNTLSLSVEVYDNNKKQFRPYTDVGGWYENDRAILDMAANVFVYDRTAVDAVKKQDRAYTAAEKALREGSSTKLFSEPTGLDQMTQNALQYSSFNELSSSFMQSNVDGADYNMTRRTRRMGQQEFATSPGSLPLPASMISHREVQPSALSQMGAEVDDAWKSRERSRSLMDTSAHNADTSTSTSKHYRLKGPLDTEASAPWYNFEGDANTLMHDGERPSAIVPMFKDAFVNIDSRVVHSNVGREAIPQDWDRVALRFKLDHPKDLDYDFWDRVGSLGITFDGTPVPGLLLQRSGAKTVNEVRIGSQ